MKKLWIILCFLPFAAAAQQDTIASGPYNWQQPGTPKNKIAFVVLVQGKAHDFEWMQLNANAVYGTKPVIQQVPNDFEEVIILKSGAARIRMGDSTFLLTPNSVAVLMPGETYSLQNAMNEHSEYYTMQYRGKNTGTQKNDVVSKSFVKIYTTLPYKPNNIGGGKRDFFECSTPMQKRFEIHVSTLKEGIRSHEPHTHKAEEIVLVINGDTEMQIGADVKKVDAGGFYFLSSNVLHAIKNIGSGPCTYFAIQFE